MSEMVRDSSGEAKKERGGLRREGTWPRMEGAGSRRDGAGGKSESGTEPVEVGFAHLWKERGAGGQRMKGVGQESHGEGRRDKDRRQEKDAAAGGRQRQDRQAGWWYQLMQSSQVYIDQSTEGSKFVRADKRKKSSERRHGHVPPTREGVVEGAEWVRPSWMGSPPESVLSQEKEPTRSAALGEEGPSRGQTLRWGRLFGSSRADGAEQRAKAPKSR